MWVKNILKAGVRSAVNIKGMSEDRLYIKEILLGKNRGVPGIRYHAKGRAGRMMRARTQITFVIEEKTVEQLYRVIMTGKFSPSIANILRGLLLSQNSSYQDIRRIQNLLTAKGRQQQKLIYKRKVEMTLEEQKAKGLILDKDYVMEQLLLEDGKKFAEEYWEFKRLETEKKIAERQEVYNKNQKSR